MASRSLAPGQLPRLRFGFARSRVGPEAHRVVLPFNRSWVAIGVSAGLLLAAAVPLVLVGSRLEVPDGGLFSLTFTLFSGFWFLGWSVGVAAIAATLTVLLGGREVLVATPGALLLRVEVGGLGLGARYEARDVSDLRVVREEPGTHAWRGDHLAFDYRDRTVEVGSSIAPDRGAVLVERLRSTLGAAGAGESLSAEGDDAVPDRREALVARPPAALGASVPSAANRPAARQDTGSSLRALVLANLVPVAGVLLLGWDLGEIMVLYWAESAVVGAYTLAKLAVVGRWASLLAGPFFLGHYGGFMVGHLLFIQALFVQGPTDGGDLPIREVVAQFVELWPALLALVLSHGVSFWTNFIGHREYAGRTLSQQMRQPYRRIVVMHVTIIVGGLLVLVLETGLPALLLLIVLKTAADVRAHAREHRSEPVLRPPAGTARTGAGSSAG